MSELKKALLEAKDVGVEISKALSDVRVNDVLKEKILAGYLSLAMQHHNSIIVLVENDILSSAAALARPLLEACYRGHWFALVADDSIIDQFNEGVDIFRSKPTYLLAKEIDEYLETHNEEIDKGVFHAIYQNNSPILHGMTHGGMEQIGRQFSEDGTKIKPTFSDAELIELIQSSDTHLAMTLLSFSYTCNNSKLSEIAHSLIMK